MRKQRGYAFSQADESQTRVLQAYDTTKERGRYGEMVSSRKTGGGGGDTADGGAGSLGRSLTSKGRFARALARKGK
jgi:phospholipid-transporting ATPase